MAFDRYFSSDEVEALRAEKLFAESLHEDCVMARSVFPAVRNGSIDFYHQGGKLFAYKQGQFTTHQKYASVLNCPSKTTYISSSAMRDFGNIDSFESGYTRIKENCSRYAQAEASSVSRLYSRYSCVGDDVKGDFLVLDIEVSFENENDDRPESERKGKRQDRIDFLIFDIESKKLAFVEAKQFLNGAIRATAPAVPKVVGQIERYNSQVKNNQNRILDQYCNHVGTINALFDIQLPEPKSIEPDVRLYIFGFDDDQKYGRLEIEEEVLRKRGVLVYSKGDPKDAHARQVWNGAK